MKFYLKILLSLCCLLFAATPAWSQSQLERHLGPLADIVKPGRSGPWDAYANNDWFMMSNTSQAGDIQYYWLERRQTSADYRISANIAVRASGREIAYGGLLFNFKQGPEYFGITIGSDKSATFLLRHKDGFETKAAEGITARGDGSDILTITVTGPTARFDLNGEKLFELNSRNGFSNKTGIIAVGEGNFGFTNYAIENGPKQAGPPQLPSSPGNRSDQGNSEPPPLPPSTAQAGPPALPNRSNMLVDQLYLSSALGIFAHELGHAIIGETKLPATGPEEDVADSFAAYILASAYAEAPPQNKDFIKGVVDYSALTWFHLSNVAQASNIAHDWQDEHSPDIKRFRNWFCIVYGSNPQAFDNVAAKVNFTDRSKARCKHDYQRKLTAWEELLATRGRNLGPDLPGKHPANTPGGKTILTFHPPETKYGQYIERLLKESKIVSLTSDYVATYFVLPRDLIIDFGDCEEVNAWYNPEKGRMVICYSAIEWFASVTARGEGLQ